MDYKKLLDQLSDGTYELLSHDGSTFHTHTNHLTPYYTKEPLLYPHLRNFMRFSDSIKCYTPKPIKYANSDSSTFNSDYKFSDDTSSQEDLFSSTPLKPNSPSNPISQDDFFTASISFSISITKTHQNNPTDKRLTYRQKLNKTWDTNHEKIADFSKSIL